MGKKKIIIISLLLIILLLVGGLYLLKYRLNNDDIGKNIVDKNNSVNKRIDNKYTYEQIDDKDITFYDMNGSIVSTYNCDKDYCNIELFKNEYSYDSSDQKVIIVGDKVVIATCNKNDDDMCYSSYGNLFVDNNGNSISGAAVLYDIKTGEKTLFENVKNIYRNSVDTTMETMIFEYTDSSYEIIDSTGKLRRKLLKDSLIKRCYEGCIIDGIDYKNNVIVTKKDNKFGIEKLSSNETIIDYKYDNIILLNNVGMYNTSNYYIGKIGNNYNLYSLANGDAITKNGYEIIEMLNDNTLLVYNNKTFSIIDLNENKITDEIIKVNGLVEFQPKMTDGYNIYTTDDIVTISISDGTSIEDRKVITYTYNLSTKELKEQLTNN